MKLKYSFNGVTQDITKEQFILLMKKSKQEKKRREELSKTEIGRKILESEEKKRTTGGK